MYELGLQTLKDVRTSIDLPLSIRVSNQRKTSGKKIHIYLLNYSWEYLVVSPTLFVGQPIRRLSA